MIARGKSVMKNSNCNQFPFVGRMQRHALAKSLFEVIDPLVPVGKGKVHIGSSIEVGVEEKTLDSYFAAVTVVVKGVSEENTNDVTFQAECKIIGFYTIEGEQKLNLETISRAAQIRGVLQIYPMVRRHLMVLLSGGDGPRFKIPMEPDFGFLRMPELKGKSTRKPKATTDRRVKRRARTKPSK